MTTSAAVIDSTDATFGRDVIDASNDVPIVVDFWAPWCGPCKTRGPLLERLANESEGAFRLVKVDIDQNPDVAGQFGVRSIPFVLGFRDGAPVTEFVGAQSETVVRQFLSRIVPDRAEVLAKEGDDLAADGSLEEAENRYRTALAERNTEPRARLGLARILASRGQIDDAANLVHDLYAEGPLAQEIERFAASLRTSGGDDIDVSALEADVEANPASPAARISLGRALAAAGRYEDALEHLMEAVRIDKDFDDAAARRTMLDLFTLLGREDPLVDRFQRELSATLFR